MAKFRTEIIRNLLEHAESLERMLQGRGVYKKMSEEDLLGLKEQAGKSVEPVVNAMSDWRLQNLKYENPSEIRHNLFEQNPLISNSVGAYYNTSNGKIAIPLRTLHNEPTSFTHEKHHKDIYETGMSQPINDWMKNNEQVLEATLVEKADKGKYSLAMFDDLGLAKPYDKMYHGKVTGYVDPEEVDAMLHEGAMLSKLKEINPKDMTGFLDELDASIGVHPGKRRSFEGLSDWLKNHYKSTLGLSGLAV